MAKYGTDFTVTAKCPVYLQYTCDYCGKESSLIKLDREGAAKTHSSDPYNAKLGSFAQRDLQNRAEISAEKAADRVVAAAKERDYSAFNEGVASEKFRCPSCGKMPKWMDIDPAMNAPQRLLNRIGFAKCFYASIALAGILFILLLLFSPMPFVGKVIVAAGIGYGASLLVSFLFDGIKNAGIRYNRARTDIQNWPAVWR